MSEKQKAYFEEIEDNFYEVRKLLQKYDAKKLSKDELIKEIKKIVDYRSEY